MVEDKNIEWLGSVCVCFFPYLCRLWTPPSIWADAVLLSNFRSPEYIMALRGRNTSVGITFYQLFLLFRSAELVSLQSLPSVCAFVPKLCETLCSNVLAGVLNASQQVGNKLVDGAFVLHCSRNTLSNFNFITLTVKNRWGTKVCEMEGMHIVQVLNLLYSGPSYIMGVKFWKPPCAIHEYCDL